MAGPEDEGPELAEVPPPLGYNPSSWNQRVRVAVIAVAGVLGSVYLALFQWGLIDGVWDPLFGRQSEQVLLSDVSHRMTRLMGIPDAALGALAYLGDILFALAGSTRRWQYRPWVVIVFGIDVIPLGSVSVIMVVLQGTVVGYWCTICLVTAVVSIVLILLAYDEVWSCLLYLRAAWRRTESPKAFWWLFWGRPSEAAHQAAEDFLRSARAERRAQRRRDAPRASSRSDA